MWKNKAETVCAQIKNQFSTLRKCLIIIGLFGLVVLPCVAQPNPKAPSETIQYTFMIGTWDCVIKSRLPDGSTREGTAVWKAHFILDGWAIQDEWVSHDESGKPAFFGINIRSFNPVLKKWECRWLPAGTLQWKHFLSWKDGETMVMEGEGEDQRGAFVDRNTFFDIESDSWSWRKDRSYDGGKTWHRAIATIEAKRGKP